MHQIKTAEVAFDRKTVYDRWAPKQLSTFEAVAQLLAEEEMRKRKALGIGGESQHASREHLPSV